MTLATEAMERFLKAVPASQRPDARQRLRDPRNGGPGLRAWLARTDTDPQALPPRIPAALIAVYLSDDEAPPRRAQRQLRPPDEGDRTRGLGGAGVHRQPRRRPVLRPVRPQRPPAPGRRP